MTRRVQNTLLAVANLAALLALFVLLPYGETGARGEFIEGLRVFALAASAFPATAIVFVICQRVLGWKE